MQRRTGMAGDGFQTAKQAAETWLCSNHLSEALQQHAALHTLKRAQSVDSFRAPTTHQPVSRYRPFMQQSLKMVAGSVLIVNAHGCLNR